MTNELWSLFAAISLGILQLFASARASIAQRGSNYVAGPRDAPAAPLTGTAGRLERAFRNFLETFPFFAAAVLMAHVLGKHTTLTTCGAGVYLLARVVYVPAYLFPVPFLRTLIWFVSMGGIVAVLAGAVL